MAELDAWVAVARGVRDPEVAELVETAPADDPELERYRRAGASVVARIRFPEADPSDEVLPPGGFGDFGHRLAQLPGAHLLGSEPWGDAFYLSDFMEGMSEAVVIEGDSPLVGVDLRVFVAAAPPRGSRLFVRRTRDRAAEARAKVRDLRKALSSRQELLEFIARELGPELAHFAQLDPSFLAQVKATLPQIAERAAGQPPPAPEPYWAVNRRYAGIEWGQLVVVTVRDPEERSRAEGLVEQLHRLRRDDALFDDILGPLGKRTPITAVAADLRDPRDPGTRKALARVRRALSR